MSNYHSARIIPFHFTGNFQARNDDNFPLYLPANRALDLDLVAVTLGLPNPTTFVQQSRDLAYPQVLAFATALSGIFLVFYLLRSFRS